MQEEKPQPANMAQAGTAVATSFFDSMRNSPALLALIVLNALTFAFLFYAITDLAGKRNAQMTSLIERCLPPEPKGPH